MYQIRSDQIRSLRCSSIKSRRMPRACRGEDEPWFWNLRPSLGNSAL